MRGLVFGLGLAIMVAAPAVGQGLPAVPTPSLPAVPTVAPNLPATPALPTPALPSPPPVPSLPHLPSVPSVPAVVGSQGASGERSPSTGRSGGASGGRSGGTAGQAGRTAAGGSSGAGPAGAHRAARKVATGRQGGSGSGSATARPAEGSADPRARAEVRRDRRLRAAVRPLEGCVGALPRRERRVLTLRAGLGGERPQTRRRVARVLRVSTRRVGRLERRGVRRLRGLVRAGRCSGAGDGSAAGDVGGATIPAVQAATLGGLAAAGLGAGSLALFAARELKRPRHSDRVEVKSERESSSGARPKAAPPAAGARPVRPRPPGAILEHGGADLTLPLLILVALAGLVLAARAVRRSGAV